MQKQSFRILAFSMLLLFIWGCQEDQNQTVSPVPDTPAEKSATAMEIQGKHIYDQNCASCHSSGVGGTPQFGIPGDWQDPIGKGLPTLVEHAISGFQWDAGMMPPRGGNSSLSDEDVKAAVHYIIDKSL